MHVFIDTNILLTFFHFTKEDIDALSNVFAPHEHGKAEVHLTEQVCDEFYRNRESKIKDALKRFNDVKFSPQLPAFMRHYEEYEKILTKSNELGDLAKALSQKVVADVISERLLTDTLIKDIFAKNTAIPVTSEIFSLAQRRISLGNPPGKNGSLGDSVNWTALLETVPTGENIHVISEDGDFYSALDENRPHPYLKSEWKRRKHAELFVYRTLSAFMKQHFDGVAFSYDKNKEAVIEDLENSGSFARTHSLIAKLEEFGYFSLKEVERILAAAVDNSQFGSIVTDEDIYTFLNRIAVPRMTVLKDADQVNLLHEMQKWREMHRKLPRQADIS